MRQGQRVISWIVRTLILRRFIGGRVLLVLGLLNWARRRLFRRNPPPGVCQPPGTSQARAIDGPPPAPDVSAVYQPSQGSSQTVQRRPR
jgi:hypothetical protein